MRRAAFAALLALAATPLAADEMIRSPSGNIVCIATETDGVAGVRCDLDAISKQSLKRPKACDLDFGQAYFVETTSKRGVAMCYGDTALGPEGRVIAYGETWRWKGLSCASSPAGMRCANARGAGFEISRQRQRLF